MARRSSRGADLIPLMAVRDLREVLELGGHDRSSIARLCAMAGLSAAALDDDAGFLPMDAVWQLFSANVSVLEDELSGLAGRPVRLGTTEIIASRAMHADDFGAALATFADAVNVLVPELKLRAFRRHGDLHLSASFRRTLSPPRQVFLEIACLPWHCTFNWLLQRPLRPRVFRTGAGRRGHGTHLLGVFDCPVEYVGEGIEIVYPGELADLPLQPPPLERWRQDIYTILVDLIRAHHDQLAAGDVVDFVSRTLHHGVTDQAVIAAAAGMSVATLRRRLSHSGTTFRTLRDDVIGHQALQLIQAGHDVDDIASQLGYSDARSFRRAFQRQFGEPPGRYRQRLRLETDAM